MALELDLGPAAQAFRTEIREWLDANKPQELVGISTDMLTRGRYARAAEWGAKLPKAGYMCV